MGSGKFVGCSASLEMHCNSKSAENGNILAAQYTYNYSHLQPFNGLFSRTTWVSRYQKGKTNLDFTLTHIYEVFLQLLNHRYYFPV